MKKILKAFLCLMLVTGVCGCSADTSKESEQVVSDDPVENSFNEMIQSVQDNIDSEEDPEIKNFYKLLKTEITTLKAKYLADKENADTYLRDVELEIYSTQGHIESYLKQKNSSDSNE